MIVLGCCSWCCFCFCPAAAVVVVVVLRFWLISPVRLFARAIHLVTTFVWDYVFTSNFWIIEFRVPFCLRGRQILFISFSCCFLIGWLPSET